MSWFGKLGFFLNYYSNSSSNSNHFITCLLIFVLHYSPQLTPSVFKFHKKTLDPLLLLLTNNNNNNNNSSSSNCHFYSYLSNCRFTVDRRISLQNGVWTHHE